VHALEALLNFGGHGTNPQIRGVSGKQPHDAPPSRRPPRVARAPAAACVLAAVGARKSTALHTNPDIWHAHSVATEAPRVCQEYPNVVMKTQKRGCSPASRFATLGGKRIHPGAVDEPAVEVCGLVFAATLQHEPVGCGEWCARVRHASEPVRFSLATRPPEYRSCVTTARRRSGAQAGRPPGLEKGRRSRTILK
jgi:hypothetical protein